MTEAFVRLENIAHRFGAVTVLDGVSLDIPKGSFTVLLGPSGSGKTTLLSILGGFLVPSAGRVLIDGADVSAVPPAQRPTTTVFQDYALFPHMTVGANVAFGLRMRGVARAEREAKAHELLALVGLEHVIGRRPHELSGGQRQRVALARALAVDPAVLLLDEPLGALDLKLRRQMQEELKAIQRRVGTTFVHVTHDQEEAMAIADRIVVMDRGRVSDEGAPERVYLRPRSVFAASFMGESNLIPGQLSPLGGGQAAVDTPLGRLVLTDDGPARPVRLSIRPEHLTSGSGGLDLGEATLAAVGFFGTHHQGEVRHAASGLVLKLRLPQAGAPVAGQRIALTADARDVVILPEEGAAA